MTDVPPPPPPPPPPTSGTFTKKFQLDWKAIGIGGIIVALAGGLVTFGTAIGRITAMENQGARLEGRLDKQVDEVRTVGQQEQDKLKSATTAAQNSISARGDELSLLAEDKKKELEGFARQLLDAMATSKSAPKQSGTTSTSGTQTTADPLGVPIGTIIPFAGPKDRIPEGWQSCEGQPMLPATYPELYSVIGTLWGGDKGTFFSLPNLNGAFLRGVDFSGQVDKERKSRNAHGVPGTQQDAATAMPKRPFATAPAGAHDHNYRGVDINPGNWQSGGSEKPSGRDSYSNRSTSRIGEHTHQIEGGDDETRPLNFAVIFIIRVK